MAEFFKKGDLVVSNHFKTSKGHPYIMEVSDVQNNVIIYYYKGESYYITVFFVRKATRFERFWGPIYDKFFK